MCGSQYLFFFGISPRFALCVPSLNMFFCRISLIEDAEIGRRISYEFFQACPPGPNGAIILKKKKKKVISPMFHCFPYYVCDDR